MLVSTEVSFHLYNNFFFSVLLFLGYFVMDDEIFVSKNVFVYQYHKPLRLPN